VNDRASELASAHTVTLVFTDIAGSTHLLEQLGDQYATLLRDHHQLVGNAVELHNGSRVDAAGDGLFFSFPTAKGALLACLDAQRAIRAHQWPQDLEVQVRMGIHTGEPLGAGTGYVGMDVHRAARICAAGHGGQVLVSDAARSLIGPTLPDGVRLVDLGEHRLKDLAHAEHLYQAVAPGLPSEFPPVRSLDTLPNNLPRQLSTFVGRAREVETIEQRLATTSVLTMTGPGGVGKTRLALEVGARLADSYPGGVWFVEFAALSDGALVPHAIASSLRLKEQPGEDLRQTLVEAIRQRSTLLIFDNCEHLLEPIAEVAEGLLRRAPDLKLLATSREGLGIAGESLVPVPSMTLPSAASASSADWIAEASRCDAVRLFVERGRAALPSFELTPANVRAIVQICGRLDGIPLAVELAAARVRALPVQQIASRLDDRFRLLTGGSRTALPRHRTLRAAMDWSFDVLAEPERALLIRLSVFAGSFSLEAAEEICSGDPVERDDVLDLLSRLIDKSLLFQDEGSSDARYRMLETIRDYAQERLAEQTDANSTRIRHRDWFAALVEQAKPGFFTGPEQAHWLARLSEDHDNLRAALEWTHQDPDGGEIELRMTAGLWRFWEIHGHLAEGSAQLARALDRTGGVVNELRASALTGAGVLAGRRGDYAAAAALHEASLVITRELGNPAAIAAACSNLASVAVARDDLDRARALYEEAIELSRRADDPRGAAFSLINLADLAARQGNHAEADELYARSIESFQVLGDRWGVAHGTSRLADVARRRGQADVAATRYEEALSAYREIGDGRGEARMLASLGEIADQRGDAAGAESLYRQSLAIRERLGDRPGMALMIEQIAGSAERPERAARLLGMAAALREAIGVPVSASRGRQLEQFRAALREKLGEEAFRTALDEGRGTPLDSVLARTTE
jgi:predicted ATPase/class 3 adenylate cyclase